MVKLKDIKFNEVEKNIYFEDINSLILTSNKNSSCTVKIILAIIMSMLLSLPSLNYYGIFSFISIILLSVLGIAYLTLNRFQKKVKYDLFIYLIVQTGIIFFLTVFLYMKSDTYHIIPAIYIVLGYISSFFITYFKTINYIRHVYTISEKKKNKFSEILATKTSKLLQFFLSFTLIGMVLYRVNKWWLLNVNITFSTVSVWEYIVWGVGLFIVLVGVTLLPTLLIQPEKLVKYFLIDKYSEEFRERYDYSKKEWYGE